MGLRKLLSKIKLQYEDPAEEKEYLSIKMPLLKDFLTYLLICMMALLIPLSIHFFAILELYPQGGMAAGMLVLAALIFLGRNKYGKWMEYVVVGYLLAIVALVIFNLGQVLLSLKSCESFYGGYAFALLHRTLGYRVVKFHAMLFFHLASLVLRLIILYDHNLSVTLMVSAVEVCTMCLSIKSEKGERDLFDALYKSKQQLIKFKDFLTEHLPHQMVIFAKDYSCAYLMNKAFKLGFQCDDIYQTKCSLKALIIEKEAINKKMSLFARLGYIPDTQTQPLSLSQFMWLLSKNLDIIRGSEVLSFQVYEDENIAMNPCTISHESGANSSDEDIVTPKAGKKDRRANKTKSLKTRAPKRGSMIFSEGPGSPTEKLGAFTERLVKKVPFEETVDNDMVREDSMEEKQRFNEEGKGRIFKVKIFMLQWDGEEAIGLMLDDISQQRALMELKMANKNKDMVVAMASHEIRTPLNGMLGLIDIAKKNVTDQKALPYLNACKNNGIFLLNLVNSMLDLSQIKARKLRLSYSEVNVKELLNELNSLFQPFSLTKKIYLKMDIAPNVPGTISTDRARLMQILINILGNAFKFTTEGGVTVKVELEKEVPVKLKFTVLDTGLGIRKEDQGRLFKLFGYLEHQDQKVNSNGVGLGLTISNTLAVMLNPYDNRGIYIESEPGKGSAFSFTVQSRSPDTSMVAKLSHETSIRDIIPAFSDDEGEEEARLGAKAAPYVISKTFMKARSEQNGMVTPQKTTNQFRSFTDSLKTKESMSGKRNEDSPWCLIVDDNPFNLMVGRYIMEEKGYWIKTVLNGKEAIEEMKEHEKSGKVFKVVLMDCEMPVMDGYGVTRALRKLMKAGEIKGCPIVALTANKEDMNLEKKCKEAGMVGCITKPLQTKELEEVLEKMKKK